MTSTACSTRRQKNREEQFGETAHGRFDRSLGSELCGFGNQLARRIDAAARGKEPVGRGTRQRGQRLT